MIPALNQQGYQLALFFGWLYQPASSPGAAVRFLHASVQTQSDDQNANQWINWLGTLRAGR
ncbi:hypothetical protein ACNKHK_14475 [Shigella flexneri]